MKCLEKDPAQRYRSALALADDLARFLRGEEVEASPRGRIARVWHWVEAQPVAASWFLTGACLLLLAIPGVVFLANYLVEKSALESARQQAVTVEKVWELYADIAGHADRAMKEGGGFPRGWDFAISRANELQEVKGTRPGVAPYPATFAILLGDRLKQDRDTGKPQSSEGAFSWRIYSRYPFRKEQAATLSDGSFEQNALRHHEAGKTTPFYQFESQADRTNLRYAHPLRMGPKCVKCHVNRELYAPDFFNELMPHWKEGDFRGVLEIVRPMDRDYSNMRTTLLLAFLALIAMGGLLLGLFRRAFVRAPRPQR